MGWETGHWVAGSIAVRVLGYVAFEANMKLKILYSIPVLASLREQNLIFAA